MSPYEITHNTHETVRPPRAEEAGCCQAYAGVHETALGLEAGPGEVVVDVLGLGGRRHRLLDLLARRLQLLAREQTHARLKLALCQKLASSPRQTPPPSSRCERGASDTCGDARCPLAAVDDALLSVSSAHRAEEERASERARAKEVKAGAYEVEVDGVRVGVVGLGLRAGLALLIGVPLRLDLPQGVVEVVRRLNSVDTRAGQHIVVGPVSPRASAQSFHEGRAGGGSGGLGLTWC